MSDIERLLTVAADDVDQPLRHSVDQIVRRGRRSARHRRIAAMAGAALTTAAIVGGLATWAGQTPRGAEPAGSPTQTITVDVDSGKPIAPAPPVSPVSDSDIVRKCKVIDDLPTWDPKPWDKAGPLDSRWSVALKTGDADTFYAVLVAPDRSVAAYCQVKEALNRNSSLGRFRVTSAAPNGVIFRPGYADGMRLPSTVTKVLVDVPGEAQVRQALMGTDGFYTLGTTDRVGGKSPVEPLKPRIRGYDADGREVLDRRLPFIVGLGPIPQR